MGHDLRKPIHVEFYGLPGCGKSTTAKILAENLRQRGYAVKEPSAEIDGLGTFRRVMTKSIRAILFYFTHPRILYETKKIIQMNGYTTGRHAWSQAVNIAQKLLVYCGEAVPCIYIWDEGMVQASASLAIGGTIASSENEQWFRSFVPHGMTVIKIYLETSLEIASKRIVNRKGGYSRVEKEHDETKKAELLRKFAQACAGIESPDCVFIADKRSAEDVASLIQSKVERILLDESKDGRGNVDGCCNSDQHAIQ